MYKYDPNQVLANKDLFKEADLFGKRVTDAKVMVISQLINDISSYLVGKGIQSNRVQYSHHENIRKCLVDPKHNDFDGVRLIVDRTSDNEACYVRLWLGSELKWDFSIEDPFGLPGYDIASITSRMGRLQKIQEVSLIKNNGPEVIMDMGISYKMNKCVFKFKNLNLNVFDENSDLIYELIDEAKAKNVAETIGEAMYSTICMYKHIR